MVGLALLSRRRLDTKQLREALLPITSKQLIAGSVASHYLSLAYLYQVTAIAR